MKSLPYSVCPMSFLSHSFIFIPLFFTSSLSSSLASLHNRSSPLPINIDPTLAERMTNGTGQRNRPMEQARREFQMRWMSSERRLRGLLCLGGQQINCRQLLSLTEHTLYYFVSVSNTNGHWTAILFI